MCWNPLLCVATWRAFVWLDIPQYLVDFYLLSFSLSLSLSLLSIFSCPSFPVCFFQCISPDTLFQTFIDVHISL